MLFIVTGKKSGCINFGNLVDSKSTNQILMIKFIKHSSYKIPR